MSHTYRAVQWNAHKRMYDLVLSAGVLSYIVLFIIMSGVLWRGPHAISMPILLIRALGTCAMIMLHMVLCIGPLARLEPRIAPLLYNRRHFGVATFLVALAHTIAAITWYHGFGVIEAPVSVLASNVQYRSISGFPFEVLGAAALVILFVMAATSHDFWLANLSPRLWKRLHMFVYLAWALLVMHVALGALQAETSPAYIIILICGASFVAGLHLFAGIVEWRRQQSRHRGKASDGWIRACRVGDIEADAAVTVVAPGGRRIAIYKYGQSISAIADRCAHQGGPLGEGRIIDGCVTCPWHGYQYRPENGQSPPPYTERVATYRVKIEDGCVWVQSEAQPPGTPLKPARTDEVDHA